MHNIVGLKIKEARKSHNPPFTQEKLAIELQILGWNIDRFGVSKIERTERQVLDKEVVLLADALGVSVAYLLGTE